MILKLEPQNKKICPYFKSGDNVPGSNWDLKRTLYVRVEEAGTSTTQRFICVWARQEIINQFAGTQGHSQPRPTIFFVT